MTDLVAADARRTKNSIIIYLMGTVALSSIFYVLVIHHSSAGLRPGFLILGLMWCPGVSGLLTRLAFQGNLRGLGLGPGEISIRELLDSSRVFEHRVRSVLAGRLLRLE